MGDVGTELQLLDLMGAPCSTAQLSPTSAGWQEESRSSPLSPLHVLMTSEAGATETITASLSLGKQPLLATGDNEGEVKVWKGGLREAKEEK